MTKHQFSLSIGVDIAITIQAEDSGRTWNGHAVPVLTDDQAAIIGAAIGEPDMAAGESDGLSWVLCHEA